MRLELELGERRLAKKGFTYEAAANTVISVFRQRGAGLLEEDISLVFEGEQKQLSNALESLKKREWFSECCVLCEWKD